MNNIIVIAPHPDDETLGCGGTILKHIAYGDNVYWLIVTSIDEQHGFSKEKVDQRNKEIEKVCKIYPFIDTFKLNIPTATLDQVSKGELVNKFGHIFNKVCPDIIYLPFKGDVHSDHKIVFDAAVSCTKWFRYSSIKRVLCYETISETDFGLDPTERNFFPNVFVDITPYLEKKLKAMKIYKSELGTHPFPRNEKVIRSLAMVRGAASGCDFAEAFVLLKEII
ncbi:hypothetical protein SDC9_14622 [bioreactor metagenome]|uniref:N-acetyl-alpha-D-glucosaminyl L-malate deacetylase 1 n=1 Tax=bioreactor metagenome TaxID=1076179 RepID=A0A644TQJ5_9ZZZZ|nr:PIG-L family deacetylase [Enterococcus thailandicus]